MRPDAIAIEGNDCKSSLSYGQLSASVHDASRAFLAHEIRVAALLADNGPAWAVADLAFLLSDIPLIPIPHFFAPQQIAHLLSAAGVDAVLTDQPEAFSSLIQSLNIKATRPLQIRLGRQQLWLTRIAATATAIPADCARITFTSGSTGEPRGVCLSQCAMQAVAASLVERSAAKQTDRHVSVLPYATLLENIGGIYAPLLAGATICAPELSAVGLSGAAGLDVQRFIAMLHESGASSCILVPQMLYALVSGLERGLPKPPMLAYIAVGGAPVSERLLQRAAQLDLPVFEGYGLSEAASVVAMNTVDKNLPGSVGKPLPHVSIRLADDGEILVRGSLFSGYLGQAQQVAGAYFPTGDLGTIDDAGFLHLIGRKKHIFITSFGRNVSPEWVERELSIEPAIAASCLFGEARPFNVAVIAPRHGMDDKQVSKAVDAANARLPDYARVTRWLMADEPFSVANGLWTGTGRPRRGQIFSLYADRIRRLYEE